MRTSGLAPIAPPNNRYRVYPDGTIKDALRLPWGYWESKDQDDDLAQEIPKKFAKGYPTDNILFEDSQTAVLIQGGQEVQRASMADADKLDAFTVQLITQQTHHNGADMPTTGA